MMSLLSLLSIIQRPPELYITAEGCCYKPWPPHLTLDRALLHAPNGVPTPTILYCHPPFTLEVHAWFWVVSMNLELVMLRAWDCCNGFRLRLNSLDRRLYDLIVCTAEHSQLAND